MKKSRLLGLLFACVISCVSIISVVLPSPTLAAVITYDFVAQITSTSISGGVPTTTIPIGEVFTGSISADPDSGVLSGDSGLYSYVGSQLISSSTLGSFEETAASSNPILVRNDRVQGSSTIDQLSARPLFSGLPFSDFGITLQSNDASALDDRSLPTILSLADWDGANFIIAFDAGSPFCTLSSSCFAGGVLTQVSATIVPLPAAVWLFGSGLLGLIGMARRKKA